jgi:hypothetical protein
VPVPKSKVAGSAESQTQPVGQSDPPTTHDSVQYPVPLEPTTQLHAAVDALEQADPGVLVRWIGALVQSPTSAWQEVPAPSGTQSASPRQWP